MAEQFNPYYKWLGISPQEQPANHYRLLGLQLFEGDPEVIDSAADRQMAHVQTHKTGPHSSLSQKLLNELAAARLCLLDPAKKAAYDQTLRASIPASRPAAVVATPVASAPDIAIVPVVGPSIERSPTVSELAARGRRPKRSLVPMVSIGLTLLVLGVALAFNLAPPQTSSIDQGSPSSDATSQTNDGSNGGSERESTAVVAADVSVDAKTDPDVPGMAEPPVRQQPSVNTLATATPSSTTSAADATPTVSSSSETGSTAASSDRPTRLDAPTGEALAAAESAVNEMFQAEIAAAKSAIEQHAVARRMFDRSFAPDLTPEVSYALLDRAAQVAASGGRYDVASEAIDSMAGRFAVDAVARKTSALETSDRFAKAVPELRRLAESWLELGNEATAADQYAAAKQCFDRAAAAARKTSDQTLIVRVVEAAKEAAARLAAYEEVTSARERLVQEPSDDAAAAAWGRFLCLYKNDWDAGLAMWAKGDDSQAATARSDLNRPPFSSGQIPLADRWWDAAEAEKSPLPQKSLRMRAAYWYRQARIGAARSDMPRIQERIDQAEQIASSFPVGQWVDLLKTIDLSQHSLRGNWSTNGNLLASPGGRGDHRLLVPVSASGSYELEASLTIARKSGPEVNLLFPVGSKDSALILFGWNGRISGLALIDGKHGDNNESTVRGVAAPRGQRFKVLIRVELAGDQASIEVDLNSRPFIRWQGASARLGVGDHFALPDRSAFGIRSLHSAVLVNSLRLRVHSGAAKRLD